MDFTPQPPEQGPGPTPQMPQPSQPQMYAPQPLPYAMQPPPKDPNETGSLVTAIVGVCFAALAAGWSFIGGSCCGWASWPLAFIGLILAIISLSLKRNALGWVALGLSIFSFAWVFISGLLLAGVLTGGTATVLHGAASSTAHPYNYTQRSGSSGGQLYNQGPKR